MKTLVLDIETSPNEVHTWGLYNQNVSLSQLQRPSTVLCWAAKWYGQKRVLFSDNTRSDMIERVWDLIDEADAVVHYNGNQFDIPTLNRDFAIYDFGPPSPHRNIDLLTTVKNRFRFTSNKLEFVAKQLGLTPKVSHEGHQLWTDVMEGKATARKKMKEYCIGDVHTTEELYTLLLPWINSHPNRQLYAVSEEADCPRCGAGALVRQGYAYTRLGKFQRYRCNLCRGWSRGNTRIQGVTEQAEL